MFEVQYVGYAFGIADRIPERLWVTTSRHRTLSAARKRMNRDHAAAKKLWGPNAWGGHWRMRTTRPVTLHWTAICMGPVCETHSPSCAQAAKVSAVWEPGEDAPDCPAPEGWHNPDMCSACRREQEQQDRWLDESMEAARCA